MSGAHVYENQLFGAPTDMELSYHQPNSPRWNLYKVMTDLLNDGRIVDKGGIVLACYSKEANTINLDSSGAGGAYITSDGKFYKEDCVHEWDDNNDGKIDRWVAYCFAQEWHDFTIKTESYIHIGRKVGTIVFESTSKAISDIIITDGNKLKNIKTDELAGAINGQNIVLNNIEEISGYSPYRGLLNNATLCKTFYIQCDRLLSAAIKNYPNFDKNPLSSICIDSPYINTLLFGKDGNKLPFLHTLVINTNYMVATFAETSSFIVDKLTNIVIKGWEEGELVSYNGTFSSLSHVYIGYGENDKTKSVVFSIRPTTPLEKIELQSGWNKPFSVYHTEYKCFINTLTEEGIVDGILKNLKQDEEMCGSGVTITLGATNLAKLTSDEAVALLDSLTNTYGYTFA
jgi:hypothetical protein